MLHSESVVSNHSGHSKRNWINFDEVNARKKAWFDSILVKLNNLFRIMVLCDYLVHVRLNLKHVKHCRENIGNWLQMIVRTMLILTWAQFWMHAGIYIIAPNSIKIITSSTQWLCVAIQWEILSTILKSVWTFVNILKAQFMFDGFTLRESGKPQMFPRKWWTKDANEYTTKTESNNNQNGWLKLIKYS